MKPVREIQPGTVILLAANISANVQSNQNAAVDCNHILHFVPCISNDNQKADRNINQLSIERKKSNSFCLHASENDFYSLFLFS